MRPTSRTPRTSRHYGVVTVVRLQPSRGKEAPCPSDAFPTVSASLFPSSSPSFLPRRSVRSRHNAVVPTRYLPPAAIVRGLDARTREGVAPAGRVLRRTRLSEPRTCCRTNLEASRNAARPPGGPAACQHGRADAGSAIEEAQQRTLMYANVTFHGYADMLQASISDDIAEPRMRLNRIEVTHAV